MTSLQNINAETTIAVKILSAETSVSSNGKEYQKFLAVDLAGGQDTVYMFDQIPNLKTPCIVNATIERKNGFLTMKSFQESDIPMVSFLPASRITDKKATWNKMIELCSKIERKGLYKVTARAIARHQKAYMSYPLTAGGAFYRYRGLFEYSMILSKQAYMIAASTGLDKSLCIAGGLLYHIGCIRTITPDFVESTESLLVGERTFSQNILEEAINDIISGEDEEAKASLVPTEIDALRHILMSSDGGIYPVLPEAFLLRYLDKGIRLSEESMAHLQNCQIGDVIERKGKYQNKLVKLP